MNSEKSITKKAEKKRIKFFQLGLIIGCSFMLLAFKWTTYEHAEARSTVQPIGDEIALPIELVPVRPTTKEVQKNIVTQTEKINITEVIEPETNIKIKVEKFNQSDLWTDSEPCLGCDDGGEEDFDLKEEFGWEFIQRTPYYDDCSQIEDKKAEAQCTYERIRNFVQKNTVYPDRPRENGVDGTVWVSFVIDENGDVVDIEEIKSPHRDLTRAALAGVSKLPSMNPGTNRHKPVRVKLSIPVKFILAN